MADRKPKAHHGDGTRFLRADGRWAIALTIAGKRHWAYATTERQADAKLAALKRLAERGEQPPATVRLDVYLTEWLEHAAPHLRASSVVRYEAVIRLHLLPRIGRVKLGSLTPAHVRTLYDALTAAGVKPFTVRTIHAVLHQALQQAMRDGLLTRNVAGLVRTPTATRSDKAPLSRDQLATLLKAAASDRWHAWYLLAATTGLRIGESLALTWSDVDLDAGRLHIHRTVSRTATGLTLADTKTPRSRRTVGLSPSVVAALRAQHEQYPGEGYVFAGEQGQLLNPATLSQSIARLSEACGLPRVTPHTLRHTFATLLMEEGVNAAIVAAALGHSTVNLTLSTYTHVSPGLQQQTTATIEALLGQLAEPDCCSNVSDAPDRTDSTPEQGESER